MVFTDRAPEPPEAPPARDAEEPRRGRMEEPRREYAQAAEPDRALVSRATAAAVDSAFNSLAQTVLGNNARTLEDLVKEMLRPMLKSWLDDNLPDLVERIVRAEIERVSRGGTDFTAHSRVSDRLRARAALTAVVVNAGRAASAPRAPATGHNSAISTNTGTAPARSTTGAASATPALWPRNNAEENPATAVPRASGSICVALVCSVLCSM